MTRAAGRSPILGAAAVAYVMALALIALWPEHVDSGMGVQQWRLTTELAEFFEISTVEAYTWIERAANVALFAPFGWFLTMLLTGTRWWAAVLLGAATSVAIELAQDVLLDGRTASASDIVTNTAGTAIGAAVGLLAVRSR